MASLQLAEKLRRLELELENSISAPEDAGRESPESLQQRLAMTRQQLDAERFRASRLEKQMQRNMSQLHEVRQQLTQTMQENIRLRTQAAHGYAGPASSSSSSLRSPPQPRLRLPFGDNGDAVAPSDASMAAPPGPPRPREERASAFQKLVAPPAPQHPLAPTPHPPQQQSPQQLPQQPPGRAADAAAGAPLLSPHPFDLGLAMSEGEPWTARPRSWRSMGTATLAGKAWVPPHFGSAEAGHAATSERSHCGESSELHVGANSFAHGYG
mmetsp:Transcript_60126/g.167773  ORF Transcript_60126/g.167773 Transcript_60126/m.167773 type:complete len:269 (-) Transcript_60126:214-1020(-)